MSLTSSSPPTPSTPFIDRPLSIGDLLDRAFRLYRARFLALVLLTAMLLIPYALVAGLITGQATADYMDALMRLMQQSQSGGPDTFQFPTQAFSGFIAGTLLVSILGMVVNGIVSLGLVHQAGEFIHGRTATISQSLRAALGRFWAFLGMSLVQFLVYGLLVGAAFVVIFLLMLVTVGGAAIATPDSGDMGSLGIIGLVLGFGLIAILGVLLAFIPMIFIVARWTVALPALLLERRGPLEALGRSWSLTQGNTWRAIGLIVLLAVLGFVISLPAAAVQQVLFLFFPPTDPSALGWITAVNTVVNLIFQVLWLPFSVLATTLFYFDLRVRKESYHLELAVAQLDQETSEQTPWGDHETP